MEKLVLYGLAAAFAAFAAKAGLALSHIRSKKSIFIVLLIYKLLFLSSSIIADVAKDWIYRMAKYGLAFHILLSLGLIIWAVTSKSKRAAPKVLAAPCPFCFMSITLSTALGAKLLGESPFIFSLKAYAVFAAILMSFYIAGRLMRIEIESVMLGAGVYYLSLIAISGFWRQTAKVYTLAQKSLTHPPTKAYWAAVIIILTLAAGMWKGTHAD